MHTSSVVVATSFVLSACAPTRAEAPLRPSPTDAPAASAADAPRSSAAPTAQVAAVSADASARAPATPPVTADAPADARIPTDVLQRRDKAMLITEIEALESLTAATSAQSPDLPRLAQRTGFEFAELALTAVSDDDAKKRDEVSRAAAKRGIERFDTAFQLDPKLATPLARYVYGLLHERLGEVDEAVRSYADVLAHAPGTELAALSAFGVGQERLGHRPQARAAFQKCTEVSAAHNPVFAEAKRRLEAP